MNYTTVSGVCNVPVPYSSINHDSFFPYSCKTGALPPAQNEILCSAFNKLSHSSASVNVVGKIPSLPGDNRYKIKKSVKLMR